jgi:hypothetical protein
MTQDWKWSQKVLKGILRTWIFVVCFYLLLILNLAPDLRDPRVFFTLFIPLQISQGFAFLVFGPLQDWMVARKYKALKKSSFPGKSSVINPS